MGKKKKRIIFNAEPVSDDACISPKYNQDKEELLEDEIKEDFDDSTMIITENEHVKAEEEDDSQYAAMILREKAVINEEDEKNKDIDIRSPEYIIKALFTDRCEEQINAFNLDEYIQDSPTKQQLLLLRKDLWTAYWSDKEIVENYYLDCRRQIRELLEKIKHQKKKKTEKSKEMIVFVFFPFF